MLQAIAMKHVSLAASGNPKSTAIVLNCLQPFENDHSNNLPELLEQFRAVHANHAEKPSTDRPPGGGAVPQSDDACPIEEASARSVSGGVRRAQEKENERHLISDPEPNLSPCGRLRRVGPSIFWRERSAAEKPGAFIRRHSIVANIALRVERYLPGSRSKVFTTMS